MAVVVLKAKAATNRDSTPRVQSNASYSKGSICGWIGVVTAGAADSIGSTYIMGQVPSNAIMHGLQLYCGAITSAAADIGLYQTTANGSAVVDADFFVAAKTIATAIVIGAEQAWANAITLVKSEKMIWEVLGLSADPKIDYDVVMTLTAAATASEKAMLVCQYAI